MEEARSSFEELLDVLSQIPDHDVDQAVSFVRQYRAGTMVQQDFPGLSNLVSRLDVNALSWLETVLCARSQQSGRDAAWRRFAESSYRELL